MAARHGAHNVRVFGFVVRGDNREDSDIDFLVDLEAAAALCYLGGLQMDLRELLHSEVDLLEAGGIHPYVRERVLSEAITL